MSGPSIEAELLIKKALEAALPEDWTSEVVDACLDEKGNPLPALQEFKGKDPRSLAWDLMETPSIKNFLVRLVHNATSIAVGLTEEEAVDSIRDWD